jgi:hypothetical protein
VPVPPGQPVLALRVTLEDVRPRVWRRLLVPGGVRLDKLHRMLQAAMGWEDYHLHSFQVGDARFGMQFDDYPDDELDEKSVTVLRAAAASAGSLNTTSVIRGGTRSWLSRCPDCHSG